MSRHEVLVILEPANAGQARREILRSAQVLQQASDRVMTVDGDAESVARVHGVVKVLTGSETAEALPGLTPAESLFSKGWLVSKKKHLTRRGEGLAWDAPGFVPPDPPR